MSLKVATADGGTDVSQVIAAINWVIQHKNDNGMNIRVLNLSYGTNSTQSSHVDPLSFAVEQAWKAGIVVVAAAGNSGYQARERGLANPAYNPFVIGVGGYDTNGTPSLADDDRRRLLGRASPAATGQRAPTSSPSARTCRACGSRTPTSTRPTPRAGSGAATSAAAAPARPRRSPRAPSR